MMRLTLTIRPKQKFPRYVDDIVRTVRGNTAARCGQKPPSKNEEIWERNHYPRHWVGNIVKDTINQLRMKEQRKGYNAGVTVKQQINKKNTEKQFVLRYRGNISNEFVKLNKIHPVQTIFTTRKLKELFT